MCVRFANRYTWSEIVRLHPLNGERPAEQRALLDGAPAAREKQTG
jgi:hypothetical protein